MAIYLGHTTAQRILESRLVHNLDPTPIRGILNCASKKSEVLDILSSAFVNEEGLPIANPLFLHDKEPLDILVGRQQDRRRWKGASCHMVSPKIPERSYLQIAEDVLVACPELCFLQQCSHLSLVGAIMLAMSFCGIYHLEGDPDDVVAPLASQTPGIEVPPDEPRAQTIFDRSPVMTIDSARAYLDGIKDVSGIDMARAALDFVLPFSGSPMETRFAIPFYLPVSLGGYGLPRPELNAVITLSEYAASLIDQRRCVGDIVWRYLESCFLFEYQSRERHDVREKYGEDYGRQLALQVDGHDVRFVTSVQLRNTRQMTALAQELAAHLHLELPNEALTDTSARQSLFAELSTFD